MHKVEFIFKLAESGYTCEQITQIEDILDSYAERSFYSKQEIRDAALQYLVCCREIDKLNGFLMLSEEMHMSFSVGYEDSYEFVSRVICGWCK